MHRLELTLVAAASVVALIGTLATSASADFRSAAVGSTGPPRPSCTSGPRTPDPAAAPAGWSLGVARLEDPCVAALRELGTAWR